MSTKKFKFVSPGVFISEIDNSQLPATYDKLGPVVIGRTERGPAMRPVRVDSFSEFIEIFGNPIPGGQGGDIWRDGNYSSPTYAAYAAQAWLKNSGPCTVVRLLGVEDPEAEDAGKAGWQTANTDATASASDNGGAYGLFIIPSASAAMTGTLAAVWYLDDGGVYLSGTMRNSNTQTTGSAVMIKNTNSPTSPETAEFKVLIDDSNGNVIDTVTFNFSRTSQRYIRKVFNTNPTLLNSEITTIAGSKSYFLGETFERAVADLNASEDYFGVILSLSSGSLSGGKFRFASQPAQTGWIISQDLSNNPATYNPANMQKLFKLVSLDTGEWDQANLKVSIQEITPPTNQEDPYGTFSVVIRRADDHDGSVKVVERFSNCNLNPNSVNYIARKIGDRFVEWDSVESRHELFGNFDNSSRFVRVEMDQDVDAGATPAALLPFGFFGPLKLNDIDLTSGSAAAGLGNVFVEGEDDIYRSAAGAYLKDAVLVEVTGSGSAGSPVSVTGNFGGVLVTSSFTSSGGDSADDIASSASAAISSAFVAHATVEGPDVSSPDSFTVVGLTPGETITLEFNPSTDFSTSSLGDATTPYFIRSDGAADSVDDVMIDLDLKLEFPELPLRLKSTDGDLSSPKEAYFGIDSTRKGSSINRFEESYLDLVRAFPEQISNTVDGDLTQHSFIFTLDDLSGSGALTPQNTYPEADYVSGSRAAETSISSAGLNQWKTVLDSGFDQFTIPLVAGFNGLDIREKDPFRNNNLTDATPKTSYEYAAIKRGIDMVKDPEVVEYSLATIPGLTNQPLNEHLIATCEARGDALALVDLQGGYQAPAENNSPFKDRVGDVDTTISDLLARGVNSSYGAAYYPWVQVVDEINNALVWVPPSVVALGVMANAERNAELWFAPAGFTRGGLTNGAAGLRVTNVVQRLSSKERDKLYSANINPIATFPAEGIVVFGQKTLQVTPSALDRINVRRLLIYVKKEISRMAATTIFRQNVKKTWIGFLGRVNPFLRGVKARFGLDDFRVVLDETTTTPDLVDRNIMYAKIFLKPTKAIEFIALDFVITDSGAGFED